MRPKSFNENDILRTIEETFRRVGYDGASLDVLTRATGLNRSSLYNAFGCKKDMMRRAVETYSQRSCASTEEVLQARPFRAALRNFLTGCACDGEHGCLIGNLVAERAEAADDDRAFLAGRLAEIERVIADAMRRAQADGEIAGDADPVRLARFVMATAQGMMLLKQAHGEPGLFADAIDTALTAIPFTDSQLAAVG